METPVIERSSARGALRLLLVTAAFAFLLGLPESLRVLRSVAAAIPNPY